MTSITKQIVSIRKSKQIMSFIKNILIYRLKYCQNESNFVFLQAK